MALTDSEVEAIDTVSIVFSVLSCLGSGFIIVCYLYYKHLRKFAFKLVFILSINDFMNQIGDFMLPTPSNLDEMENGTDPVSTLCYVQSVWESYFELTSVLWTTAIAATLYMSVIRRIPAPQIQAKEKWYHLFCNGLPAILTLIPGVLGAYGPAGAWCWIEKGKEEWRFIQFYVPLWIAIIFNGFVYVRVIRIISNTFKAAGASDSGSHRQMSAIVRKLKFYPLILVTIWIFGTINRIYEASSGTSSFELLLLQKTFSSMQGLLNAIAYGLTGGVREAIRESLGAKCPCLRESKGNRLVRDASPGRGRLGGLEARDNPAHTSRTSRVDSLSSDEEDPVAGGARTESSSSKVELVRTPTHSAETRSPIAETDVTVIAEELADSKEPAPTVAVSVES